MLEAEWLQQELRAAVLFSAGMLTACVLSSWKASASTNLLGTQLEKKGWKQLNNMSYCGDLAVISLLLGISREKDKNQYPFMVAASQHETAMCTGLGNIAMWVSQAGNLWSEVWGGYPHKLKAIIHLSPASQGSSLGYHFGQVLREQSSFTFANIWQGITANLKSS